MTSINHHPSDELLLDYSAGNVTGGNAVCIASHIELCSQCKAAHKRNNAIGGALISKLESQKVSDQLKNKVLQSITRTKAEVPASPASTEETKDFEKVSKPSSSSNGSNLNIPRAIRSFVPDDFSALDWSIATASAKTCLLFKDELGAAVSLLRIKPGGKISNHKHMGDEYTLILSGSFSDEDGIYKAGDFMLRNDQHQHTPVATKDAECICLTVQEAPLQFTGRLWRMLNPFIRKSFQPI
ncbi:MAG: ChrR family anti-sigma-E factor [Cellvibrionaceae bacterium]